MRIVTWIKGARGVACLKAMIGAREDIVLLVLQNQPDTSWFAQGRALAEEAGIPVTAPDDPNSEETRDHLAGYEADLFVLAGYGKIISKETIALPKVMCVNLHGGRLPEQRGSSPLNWVLVNGQDSFGISIIQVDEGVDTGPVLSQRSFSIGPDDTIADIHAMANAAFPEMLLETLEALRQGTMVPTPQPELGAAYHPARFPDDGLVLFDQLTAGQVHGMVRALTDPYPGAYTYHQGRRVRLLSSRLREQDFFGTPGRVYLIKDGSVLVCAKDKCLWIDRAEYEDDRTPLARGVARYDRLATVAQAAERILSRPEST